MVFLFCGWFHPFLDLTRKIKSEINDYMTSSHTPQQTTPEATSGARLTYELICSPDAKTGSISRVAALEARVSKLERVIGALPPDVRHLTVAFFIFIKELGMWGEPLTAMAVDLRKKLHILTGGQLDALREKLKAATAQLKIAKEFVQQHERTSDDGKAFSTSKVPNFLPGCQFQ